MAREVSPPNSMPITRGVPRVLDLKTFSTGPNGSNAGAKERRGGKEFPRQNRHFWREMLRKSGLNPLFVGVDEVHEGFDVVALSQAGLLLAHFQAGLELGVWLR